MDGWIFDDLGCLFRFPDKRVHRHFVYYFKIIMMKLHEGEEIVKMMFALDFKTHLLTRNLRSNRDGLVDGRIEDLQCNATLFFFFHHQ